MGKDWMGRKNNSGVRGYEAKWVWGDRKKVPAKEGGIPRIEKSTGGTGKEGLSKYGNAPSLFVSRRRGEPGKAPINQGCIEAERGESTGNGCATKSGMKMRRQGRGTSAKSRRD